MLDLSSSAVLNTKLKQSSRATAPYNYCCTYVASHEAETCCVHTHNLEPAALQSQIHTPAPTACTYQRHRRPVRMPFTHQFHLCNSLLLLLLRLHPFLCLCPVTIQREGFILFCSDVRAAWGLSRLTYTNRVDAGRCVPVMCTKRERKISSIMSTHGQCTIAEPERDFRKADTYYSYVHSKSRRNSPAVYSPRSFFCVPPSLVLPKKTVGVSMIFHHVS